MQPETKVLRSMMRPYEGARHTVAAFSMRAGVATFLGSGSDTSKAGCEDLIFEIGSITKVFTSILLWGLIGEGKIDPRAPVCHMSYDLKDLPSGITPECLVTHTSGLPNFYLPIWKALINQRPEGPYAKFSRADLLEWIHNWRGAAPGSKRRHVYSNLGMGMLGEAMAMMEGQPYGDLLAEKVIEPLGLKDTTDLLDKDRQDRFAHPRNTKGKTVSPWTFQALAGAGCLRSSAQDLAHFSRRVIKALKTPETTIDHAICHSAVPLLGLGRHGRMEPTAQCSGWLAIKLRETDPGFLFHNGGTAGSSCALYICPEKDAALGILCNNGVAANLWASTKLSWSNQFRQATDFFAAA